MEELAIARERDLPAFVSEQPPYNLLDRRIENELLPMCERYGLAVAAVVAARRRDPQRPLRLGRQDVPEDSRAARLAQTRGAASPRPGSRSRLRWASWPRARAHDVAARAAVGQGPAGITAPIVGPRTMEQLDDALAVLDLSLDDDARAALR